MNKIVALLLMLLSSEQINHVFSLSINGIRLMEGKGIKDAKLHNRRMKALAKPPSEPLDNIQEIRPGFEHNCVIFSADSKIKCWGANGSGQLGYGDTITRGDGPKEMGNDLPFVDIGKKLVPSNLVVGGYHTCVRFEEKAKCWGDNSYGQLMLGDLVNRGDKPKQMGDRLPFIDLGNDRKIFDIITGLFHTCVISYDSKLYCFGSNEYGQLGYGDKTMRGGSPNDFGINAIPINITSISTLSSSPSSNHTCARVYGGVKCWGQNNYGQLGYGDTNNRGDDPNEMGDKLPLISLPSGKTSIAVYVGGSNSCILFSGFTIACFGNNKYGQLGIGSSNNVGDQPKEMGNALKMMNVGTTQVYAAMIGDNYICAWLPNYQIKCFGNNDYGQLGQGDTKVKGTTSDTIGAKLPIIDFGYSGQLYFFVSGGNHNCVIFLENLYMTKKLKCFGKNTYGALGYGDTINRGDGIYEMGTNLTYVQVRVPPPTRSPSEAPTFAPSKVPTIKPSKKPTNYPTKKPSKTPTSFPTKN